MGNVKTYNPWPGEKNEGRVYLMSLASSSHRMKPISHTPAGRCTSQSKHTPKWNGPNIQGAGRTKCVQGRISHARVWTIVQHGIAKHFKMAAMKTWIFFKSIMKKKRGKATRQKRQSLLLYVGSQAVNALKIKIKMERQAFHKHGCNCHRTYVHKKQAERTWKLKQACT